MLVLAFFASSQLFGFAVSTLVECVLDFWPSLSGLSLYFIGHKPIVASLKK